MRRALVLDLDGSVHGLPDATVVPLQSQQEGIRFACGLGQLRTLAESLESDLDTCDGVRLLGSGDFHHVSFALIERVARHHAVEIVVLDNHPDNMRWLGGIHCGSWVRHVARLTNVTHVHVLGITSTDISARQLWENYLSPLWRGRLTYWSVGVSHKWMHRLGFREAFRNFDTAEALCEAFAARQSQRRNPVYVSIDKDVLSPQVVTCNWDQGCFDELHLEAIIATLSGRIVAADITGDISAYDYKAAWKRWISARDDQPEVNSVTLQADQARHGAVNRRLVSRIHEAMCAGAVTGYR